MPRLTSSAMRYLAPRNTVIRPYTRRHHPIALPNTNYPLSSAKQLEDRRRAEVAALDRKTDPRLAAVAEELDQHQTRRFDLSFEVYAITDRMMDVQRRIDKYEGEREEGKREWDELAQKLRRTGALLRRQLNAPGPLEILGCAMMALWTITCVVVAVVNWEINLSKSSDRAVLTDRDEDKGDTENPSERGGILSQTNTEGGLVSTSAGATTYNNNKLDEDY